MELTVSILQTTVTDVAGSNVERVISMASGLSASDVLLLPASWPGGDAGAHALSELCLLCSDIGVHLIAGAMPWPAEGGVVDRSWVINDAGDSFAFYDRAHIFSGHPAESFQGGTSPLFFSIAGVGCSVAIGYDICFPEYVCSIGRAGASVIFVPAAWPATRGEQWEFTLRAAASAAQAYVVACNISGGSEGSLHFGRSIIVSPWGGVIASLGREEGVLTATLNLGEVERCRGDMPLGRDRRGDLYRLLRF
ncbi:MAG: hypothetical protein LBT31_04885 [Synergistaceae bacterium]|jgi:predicted amidohydrolase|nr:hypothetical protein [Synergistaceae bacterium]